MLLMFMESDSKAPTSTGPAIWRERKKMAPTSTFIPWYMYPCTSPSALKLDSKSPSYKIQAFLNCCSVCVGLRASEPFKRRVSHCTLDLPNISLLSFKARHHGNFISGADAIGYRAQREAWAPHSSEGNPMVVIFFWLWVTILGMWVLMRSHLFSSSASQCDHVYIYT